MESDKIKPTQSHKKQKGLRLKFLKNAILLLFFPLPMMVTSWWNIIILTTPLDDVVYDPYPMNLQPNLKIYVSIDNQILASINKHLAQEDPVLRDMNLTFDFLS